jgi:HPt (histidine-containing phosphotransfer) domain-containing protein
MSLTLDIEALLERAGTLSFAHEILGDFCHGIAGEIETLRAAASTGDLPNLSRRAHRLRGSLLAIGADDAADEANALEDSAGNEDASMADAAFERLLAALVVLVDAIRIELATVVDGTLGA